MLTKKQVEDLPVGTYTNQKLMEMFPKQQGKGRSKFDREQFIKTLKPIK